MVDGVGSGRLKVLAREVQQLKARGRGEVLEEKDVLLGIGGRVRSYV
jgi:hypothetical protein